MINNYRLFIPLLFALLSLLQACTRIKAPYTSLFQSSPTIIKTSVGNVEVLKLANTALAKKQSSKGMVYLIPGFPGSSLENIPLARALVKKGYTTYLLNPPGHGRVAIGNKHWQFRFPQYAQALDESLRTLQATQKPATKQIIIAHSAGAEMVFQLLLKQSRQEIPPKYSEVILINPWLPSIINVAIPWTNDDEDLLHYPPLLVRLFGPFSKKSVEKRLFLNPQQKTNARYLKAHEKLTENLNGWWPFDYRFVRLMKATTRTQKTILKQGKQYEQAKNKLAGLSQKLARAKTRLIIINSAKGNDQIIPCAYKQSLQKALRKKLTGVDIQLSEVKNAGHMLQVEQTGQVVNQLILDESTHQE